MKNKIQIVKPIGKEDKTVLEAIKISKQFKVLSFKEVESRLSGKASDYSLSRANA